MDGIRTVVLRDGKVAEVAERVEAPSGALVVDARGKWVTPGFVDLHVHLREPGQEYKENVATGTRAAVAGGFTSVCAMPNTVPANDNTSVTELMLARAAAAGLARVYPVGAATKGRKGEELAEYGELKTAGCVALSDDGSPVMSSGLMRRALEYARAFGLPLAVHEEDLHLVGKGVMNEGPTATRLGLKGVPAQAEDVIVARDLLLAEYTGARYHVAHASTLGTVRLLREAKSRGLAVSAEVTPHHLLLTDVSVIGYDTFCKVNPPLREEADIEALRSALADGTIDAIATDHAPHTSLEKESASFPTPSQA